MNQLIFVQLNLNLKKIYWKMFSYAVLLHYIALYFSKDI